MAETKISLLEQAAAAHWNFQVDEFNQWSELSDDEKEEALAPMRIALSFLANSELIDTAATIGADWPAIDGFRAVLQAITRGQ